MPEIFISYSWSNAKIADQLDALFYEKGISLKRDIRDVKYTESIKEFMKKVRTTDYCLMIISNEYLRSMNCMYEVLEFIKDDNYLDKILPIATDNAKIFDAKDRSQYIEYWQEIYEEHEKTRSRIESMNQSDLLQEMKMIENIKRNIADFLKEIADMNLRKISNDITLEEFEKIYKIVDPTKNDASQDKSIDGYFVLNIPQTINEKIFTWWIKESKGYTQDIRQAKIFTRDEVVEMFVTAEYVDWDNKKYAAIPIGVVVELGQNIIPYIYTFISQIEKQNVNIYGNKKIYLSKEEIKTYY